MFDLFRQHISLSFLFLFYLSAYTLFLLYWEILEKLQYKSAASYDGAGRLEILGYEKVCWLVACNEMQNFY